MTERGVKKDFGRQSGPHQVKIFVKESISELEFVANRYLLRLGSAFEDFFVTPGPDGQFIGTVIYQSEEERV